MTNPQRSFPQSNDRLLHVIIGSAVTLSVLYAAVVLVWGPGPVVAILPWYVPTAESFGMLAALSVAFLAFGRYRVLREATPFWIGLAFASYATVSLFFLLSFPGLLPSERGIIARLPNTSVWPGSMRHSIAAIFLFAAILPRREEHWPQAGNTVYRQSLWLVTTILIAIVAMATLPIAFEQRLPLFVVDGQFTPLLLGWISANAIALGACAALSAYRYRQTGDLLIGYASLAELLLAFGLAAAAIGGRRYTLLWYWLYVPLLGGLATILFGLLSEYVALFQREREHARQLAELDRLKDQFLTVAAHELKTPVTSVKGYAQFLLRREQEGVSPVGLKVLEAIDRQSDRMSRLVNGLLEISRLQTGRLELRLTRIDLSNLVAEAVELMQIAKQKHRLLFQSPGPVFVSADADRVEQVIESLLDNAIKFSPEGGVIETTVGIVDGEAVVSVRDHGVGITKDKQARIFERFYRAHASTPRDYGGMGVGLFISRETIGRHGGRMWFESEEGQGSTFHFSLPKLETR